MATNWHSRAEYLENKINWITDKTSSNIEEALYHLRMETNPDWHTKEAIILLESVLKVIK